jgi:hypothetical protein
MRRPSWTSGNHGFSATFHTDSNAGANGGRALSGQRQQRSVRRDRREAMPTLDLAVLGLMAGYAFVSFLAVGLMILLAANRH